MRKLAVDPGPTKPKIKPGKKMKPLFWTKIPAAKIRSTVWVDFDESGIDIKRKEFEDLFCKPSKKKVPAGGESGSSGASKPKNKKISYLDGKRQQNAGIALSQVKLTPDEVQKAILALDEKVLTIGKLNAIRKIMPTAEEKKSLGQHDTSKPELIVPIDQFMLALLQIPRCEFRVQCMIGVSEFEEKYEVAHGHIEDIKKATAELHKSERIKQILETILALGNHMNGSTSRGQCVGFQLKDLSKLEACKSKDNKITLMQYMVKLLSTKQLDLSKTADIFSEACKLTLSQCGTEVGAVRKIASLVKREVEKAESAPPMNLKGMSDKLVKKLKPFLKSCQAQVARLEKDEKEMTELYNKVVKGYAEDPNKVGPDEFFKYWNNFCKAIEKACMANDKIEDAEAKKAAKARPSVLPKGSKGSGSGGLHEGSRRQAAHISARPQGQAAMMGQLSAILAAKGKK